MPRFTRGPFQTRHKEGAPWYGKQQTSKADKQDLSLIDGLRNLGEEDQEDLGTLHDDVSDAEQADEEATSLEPATDYMEKQVRRFVTQINMNTQIRHDQKSRLQASPEEEDNKSPEALLQEKLAAWSKELNDQRHLFKEETQVQLPLQVISSLKAPGMFITVQGKRVKPIEKHDHAKEESSVIGTKQQPKMQAKESRQIILLEAAHTQTGKIMSTSNCLGYELQHTELDAPSGSSEFTAMA